MTNRERIVALLNGNPIDKIPWIPRIDIWYNSKVRTGSMPMEFRGKTLENIQSDLRIGNPARGGAVFAVAFPGVDHVSSIEGDRHISEYHTPHGSLREVTVQTQDHVNSGVAGTKVEHLLKTPRDYRIWEYVMERSEYIPTYEQFSAYDTEVGPHGLPIVSSTASPCYLFLEDLAGFKSAYYHLADYEDEVSHLFQCMEEVFRSKAWPIIANSPAKLVLTGAHLSTQLTPPNLFSRYVLPYTASFNRFLQDSGKKTALHGDGDTGAILQLIEKAGFDMVECFVTAPMVPTTLVDAKKAWGDRLVIWGGIPSSIMEPSYQFGEFKDYVKNLFRTIAPGNAFILGVADNVMPTSDIDRLKWVSDYVDSSGSVPISR